MSIPLFISTSPSDFHILKELVKEQSKFQKVDFLILFKLEKSMIVDLEKKNINLHLKKKFKQSRNNFR